MPVLANLYYTQYQGSSSSRPPVILIHGAGSNHLCWPAEIRRLRDTTVYTIDLPGHGKSEGTAQHRVTGYQSSILNFIEQIKQNRVVLVGHSLGAAIALQFAYDHPQHVAGLVCISSAASFKLDPTFVSLFRSPGTQKTTLELLQAYFTPQHGKYQWFSNLEKSLITVRNSLWYADFRASEHFDLRSELPQIKKPTLVLSGEEDSLVPVSDAAHLARHLPEGRFISYPRHGHMLMLEEPTKVAQAIHQFYAKLCG